LTGDSRQQRPPGAFGRGCNAALVRAAQWRAQGLANGDPWSHTDAAGVTANEYAVASGCALPSYYSIKGNNIESLGAGTPSPVVMFTALASSNAHKTHLFGENDFFREQDAVGIAYVERQGSPRTHYWVVMIAICE